ncbi:hypothetical protein K2Z83_22845 [Oscillochloris sp. ZM17-4]|uniref:phage antirepressor N-terminal domain-containing protein n=1 Tax=Oscillochloris sp. ZM17-4 TaxID=2866714 RepID=UPI001C73A4F0|nr:hypothetical protein [Oscillochloris sp. ZM17-4]
MPAPRQKVVTFYGDEVIAIQQPDTGAIFVPIARLCDNLGIARNRQAQRIREHPVISQGFTSMLIDTGGGAQESQCLRLDMIPYWLAGVNANRVAEGVREKLIRYQTEVATVLWEAFRPEILAAGETPIAAPLRSGAELAYEIATAVQHLARQQMDLEARLNRAGQWAKTVDLRLDTVDTHIGEVEDRLGTLELQVSPQQPISEEQAADLALSVKAVANALEQRGTRNGYQRVYGELYRQQGITSYKNLPRGTFAAVMDWLKAWHAELIQDDARPQ